MDLVGFWRFLATIEGQKTKGSDERVVGRMPMPGDRLG